MKKLAIAAATTIGLGAAAMLALVLFVDLNQFRPQLEAAMSGALGRKVAVGRIAVAPLTGGIAIEDLSVADDPAFSTDPFVTAKSVTVSVDLIPLIVSRSLRIRALRLDRPRIALISSESGRWNFSGLGGASPDLASGDPSPAMRMMIRRIEIADGQLTVARRNDSTLRRRRGTREGGRRATRGSEAGDASGGAATHGSMYDGIDLEVRDLSIGSRSPFRLTARASGGGTLRLDGYAGPLDAADAALTPVQATVEVDGLDLASSGLVDRASGLAGAITLRARLTSDGRHLASDGRLTVTRWQLVPGGSPATEPLHVAYASSYALEERRGAVSQGEVRVGSARAQLTGDYAVGDESLSLRMRLSGSQMPAADLQAAFPAVGFSLPAGATLSQGTLDVNLGLTGGTDRLVVTGPLNVSKVAIAGFDLAGQLGAMPLVGGVAPASDTIIETLAALIRVGPDGIRADDIRLVAPAVGSLTGAGTISPRNELDFRVVARFAGALPSRLPLTASARAPAAVPFRVIGTTERPVFVPDVGRSVGDAARELLKPESANKAASALRGLFGGKKR